MWVVWVERLRVPELGWTRHGMERQSSVAPEN